MTARLIFIALLCLCGVLATAAEWPGASFTEVRAYAYNRHNGHRDIITNGRLNGTVLNKRGILLAAEQTRVLVASVTGKRPVPEWAVSCFNPHHAFVFYDTAHRPVAWVEVCFECGNAIAEPIQKGQVYDVSALERLAAELRLPLVARQGLTTRSSEPPLRSGR